MLFRSPSMSCDPDFLVRFKDEARLVIPMNHPNVVQVFDIGVGDKTMMLQYSTYSVISPEGCATILWKSAERASDAAEAMGITAPKLKDAGFIDQVIREPLGSAHRDVDDTARNIKQALVDSLQKFETMGLEKLLEERYRRLTSYGEFLEESKG